MIMRSTLIVIGIALGFGMYSCSEEGNVDDLRAKELELKERELELREKERNKAKDEVEEKSTERSSNWKFYHNQRYDFCVDYPSDFLHATGESQNEDGNTFANANNSSEMRASGMYNALDQTIADAFKAATEKGKYYDDERVITYKQQKGNWFVVSGKYNESIFYVRTVLKGDTFYTLYFEYHSSETKKFAEIIARVGKKFPDC